MSEFFQRNQRSIDLLPRDAVGLRRPQLGAAAALIAHGTKTTEPAVIALPTGTGKTAVLQMTPFLWATGRVLVLTPSRMVRDQILEGFASLELLSELGVLPPDIERPRIASIDHRVTSASVWEGYRDIDVVVTTPMSASPSIEGIAPPPADLFDLVMIDEGIIRRRSRIRPSSRPFLGSEGVLHCDAISAGQAHRSRRLDLPLPVEVRDRRRHIRTN